MNPAASGRWLMVPFLGFLALTWLGLYVWCRVSEHVVVWWETRDDR